MGLFVCAIVNIVVIILFGCFCCYHSNVNINIDESHHLRWTL